MRRYINAEPDAKFQALNGWYDTGDIARVDDEGHVEILGRLKRFAKISGEMVSLTAIEDALAGAFASLSLKSEVVIVTRPDADKGEALIAVTNEPRIQLEAIRTHLKARGFSNLCVPREVSTVKEIPKLGTGKTDYRELSKRLESKS
jgi:acyl-[acyl-carrier-protein]-phospholipid O-acyltransferase/long-chain-fatty-acid--[acyl-carrier-protein] ligase